MKTISPTTTATGLQQPDDAVPVFRRAWAMPNKDTFAIRPIRKLIERYLTAGVWVDPFCGNSPWKHRMITNDLNPKIEADWGIKRGYELLEVLLVAHGGTRHDTIVTVERKT